MKKTELIKYLDEFLGIKNIQDLSFNGLVVDTKAEEINKIAISVDSSVQAFKRAVQEKAELVIVHHGLYWGKVLPLRGSLYKRIEVLISAGIGLYAAHLPLDIHKEVGNNYGALKKLGFQSIGECGEYHGINLGVVFEVPEEKREFQKLVEHISEYLYKPKLVWHFGPNYVDKGVYCSGGCLSILEQVAEAGYRLFITGEPSHAYYKTARELGMNVIFLGHWASETIGVQLLAQHLKEKFGIDYVFVDEDTGL